MSAEPHDPRDSWSALQRRLGQRLARRLFDDISRNPIQPGEGQRTRWTWSLALAYVLATLVYATTLALGVAGVLLLIEPWTFVFRVFVGIMLLVLCVAARPRLIGPPDVLLARADYPTLHRLCDRMAQAMGAAPVDGIGVSAEFNANYRVAGWRRRRYVEFGAPLLAILTPAERVAVLAHELSHGANGDPLRGQFLFGAVHTLITWATAIRPVAIGRGASRTLLGLLVGIVAIPFELLLLAASDVLYRLAGGLLMLVFRQSQRAEYLADLLAATVAGTAEMQRALEKSDLFDVVDAAARAHALTQPHEAIGPWLHGAVLALSPADMDGYRDQSRAANWQVDSTHPPTALRVDMLAAHAPHAPSRLLSPVELAALKAEVERLIASTQREIVNRQLEAVYG